MDMNDNDVLRGFPGGSGSKESAGNAGSIPGSGRSPKKGMATHSSILAWKIPLTEEPSFKEFSTVCFDPHSQRL